MLQVSVGNRRGINQVSKCVIPVNANGDNAVKWLQMIRTEKNAQPNGCVTTRLHLESFVAQRRDRSRLSLASADRRSPPGKRERGKNKAH